MEKINQNKMTAVEWFAMITGGWKYASKAQLEQAKEMEKDQSLKIQPYDLDELAMEYSEGKSTSEVFKKAHESDFKAGFQKALELLTLKTK
jgi:hypothetical protein